MILGGPRDPQEVPEDNGAAGEDRHEPSDRASDDMEIDESETHANDANERRLRELEREMGSPDAGNSAHQIKVLKWKLIATEALNKALTAQAGANSGNSRRRRRSDGSEDSEYLYFNKALTAQAGANSRNSRRRRRSDGSEDSEYLYSFAVDHKKDSKKRKIVTNVIRGVGGTQSKSGSWNNGNGGGQKKKVKFNKSKYDHIVVTRANYNDFKTIPCLTRPLAAFFNGLKKGLRILPPTERTCRAHSRRLRQIGETEACCWRARFLKESETVGTLNQGPTRLKLSVLGSQEKGPDGTRWIQMAGRLYGQTVQCVLDTTCDGVVFHSKYLAALPDALKKMTDIRLEYADGSVSEPCRN